MLRVKEPLSEMIEGLPDLNLSPTMADANAYESGPTVLPPRKAGAGAGH